MNLKNGYKVIYEKIVKDTDGDKKRIFYATSNKKCDPTVDDVIAEAIIGEYKLIYEKDGRFYGSETGIPAEGDYCFEGFDKVFVELKPVDDTNTGNDEPKQKTPVETPVDDNGDDKGNNGEGEQTVEE